MTEEAAARGVDSETGGVIGVVSILVKVVVQIAMSGDDVRLSIALFVWSDSGEQNERRLARLEYLARPQQILRIRVDVVRTENYEIVIDLIGGSGDRVCEPEWLCLLYSTDRNTKITRRKKLNNPLRKMSHNDRDLLNPDRLQRLNRSLEQRPPLNLDQRFGYVTTHPCRFPSRGNNPIH